MAKLYFRYGAMGSSKTANAIMVQYNYRERGKNAIILKPQLDNRDGERYVGSRSGLNTPCGYVEELPQIDLTNVDCVIVDEAQFMTREQVEYLTYIVDDLNIPVICYGLRADFRGELFPGSQYLLAWADTIEELKTVCWCGRKASYNTRVFKARVVREGAQIMLGGSESYVALCRRHWKNGDLGDDVVKFYGGDRKIFMPLFLIADEEEQAIMKYYSDGELYGIFKNGVPVSEMLLTEREDGQQEIKSLATLPEWENHGFAGRLIKYAQSITRDKLYVGTSDGNIPFYEKNGFRVSYVAENFFRDNYEKPIIENGKVLKDMTYLCYDIT